MTVLYSITSILSQADSGMGAGAGEASSIKSDDFWMPVGASNFAAEVDWVFHFINYINYFFFVLVVGIMCYFVWKYRQKGREVYARGPSHNMPLELGWTILPTIIVVVIFFIGFKGYVSMRTVPADAYQIDVTAQQWSWQFKYPNGATSPDLYVPAGKPVKLVMRSNDVLHSLYIPDFRVKQDVVPGRYTTMWFQADEATGEEKFHRLYCTEYCGKDHSRMNQRVFVLGEVQFNDWVTKQGRWLEELAQKNPGDPAILWKVGGPRLYARCASCHTLDGTTGTGPSWGNYDGSGDVWDRIQAKAVHKVDGGKPIQEFIGEGKQYATPEAYLRASILNPGEHIVDGYGNVMPTFKGQLRDSEIDVLIDMMKNLKDEDGKPNFDAKGKFIGSMTAAPSDSK
jgi:cytochrome c oxidase subunit 2